MRFRDLHGQRPGVHGRVEVPRCHSMSMMGADEDAVDVPGPPQHRAVRRPPPGAVHDKWIVVAHVHHFALRLGKVAVGGSARAQRLHGDHDRRLLMDVGLREVVHPLRAFGHALQQLRIGNERVHARMPVRLRRRAARGFAHLVGIGGGHEDVGDELVGVERDRGEERVELGLLEAARLARQSRGKEEKEHELAHGKNLAPRWRHRCNRLYGHESCNRLKRHAKSRRRRAAPASRDGLFAKRPPGRVHGARLGRRPQGVPRRGRRLCRDRGALRPRRPQPGRQAHHGRVQPPEETEDPRQ